MNQLSLILAIVAVCLSVIAFFAAATAHGKVERLAMGIVRRLRSMQPQPPQPTAQRQRTGPERRDRKRSGTARDRGRRHR